MPAYSTATNTKNILDTSRNHPILPLARAPAHGLSLVCEIFADCATFQPHNPQGRHTNATSTDENA